MSEKKPMLATPVEVLLDKPRKMLYDFNAEAIFLEKTGKDEGIFSSMQDIAKKMSEQKPFNALKIRDMLWAMLNTCDSSVTVEEVGKMFDLGDMAEVFAIVQKVVLKNTPKATQKVEGVVSTPLEAAPQS